MLSASTTGYDSPMRFAETELKGAFVVELETIRDNRGFFACSFSTKEFEERGLQPLVAQCNVSFNVRKGTLRGMHFSVPPSPETKLVRCTRGVILDVIVDLRPDSPTYLRHVAVELSAANRRALYVPPLFAHGYQTLTDDSEVHYQIDRLYDPATQRGYRYDDPAFGIDWPLEVTEISEKDAAAPLVGDR
jgi:dTDP-4-dehydrorhamnose 3,5-epimerase